MLPSDSAGYKLFFSSLPLYEYNLACGQHSHFCLFVDFVFRMFRPLSKTKRFNVLKVTPAGSSGAGKKAFTGI